MKARIGPKNGRWKGVPKEAESYFISGYYAGLSCRTLSIRWKKNHGEHIDSRRIERWIKGYSKPILSEVDLLSTEEDLH